VNAYQTIEWQRRDGATDGLALEGAGLADGRS
jgi:hypothetical protein